jgi:hypothetical protein
LPAEGEHPADPSHSLIRGAPFENGPDADLLGDLIAQCVIPLFSPLGRRGGPIKIKVSARLSLPSDNLLRLNSSCTQINLGSPESEMDPPPLCHAAKLLRAGLVQRSVGAASHTLPGSLLGKQLGNTG